MVNIAVLGYGTVGSGVVEVIHTNPDSINKKAGEEFMANIAKKAGIKKLANGVYYEVIKEGNGEARR